MPARSAARLSRTPREHHTVEQEQRRRTLAALLADLENARTARAPWYVYVEQRADGRHAHDLRDEHGHDLACPVAGCDARRGSATPHVAAGSRKDRRGSG